MASVILQTSLSGPTDNGGSCRVLYEIINATGVAPEIFVILRKPTPYKGGEPVLVWQHVAYADELTEIPVQIEDSAKPQLVRKATALVQYNSLEAAETAIQAIKSQIQRLMNELKTLSTYTETNTWVISSTN